MKIVVQKPKPPQALRLLLQANDDADGIEVALAAAGVWAGEKLTLVVNGTGRDLSAFADRHSFAVLCDDAGRPTRSLTEISEAFEDLDREKIGAVVVLDTNRIYRATRCAVRDIEQIKALSPGHWDDTNEALGRVAETLTRSGVPSIFVAPPTDVMGYSEDGEQVVVGSKPQAWKDLARQSHAQLALRRRGRVIECEVAGDDWRRVGVPGDVVEITGESLGRRFADLSRGRSGEAAGTTLAEATAAELAARTRRVGRRRAASEDTRNRLAAVAYLRAYQGPEAWARHVAAVSEAIPEMDPADADQLTKANAAVLHEMGKDLQWMRLAEQTIELSPYSLHASDRWEICGPSIDESPARDDMPVGDLPHDKIAELAMSSDPEDLPAWVASLAVFSGVWSEPSFAVVCKANGLDRKGPSWDAYSDKDLRQLVRGLLWLASIRRQFDPPEKRSRPVLVPAPVEDVAAEDEPLYVGDTWEVVEGDGAPVDFESGDEPEDDPAEKIESFIERFASGQGATVQRTTTGSANGVAVTLPDPAAFVVLSEQAQLDTLGFLLQQVGAFEDWDGFRRGTKIGPSKSPRRWSSDERAEIYRAAITRLGEKAAA